MITLISKRSLAALRGGPGRTRRTALVTGGTDGIGKAIARTLASMGHRTIIVGRNATKGHLAAMELRERTSNQHVEFIRADLSRVRDTDALASTISGRCSALHYLIHSAGVIYGRRELTSEGVELMFATNFLNRYVLTRALLPLIEATGRRDDPSRLLFVSGAARGGRIDYDDPSLGTGFSLIRAVRQFCLANDLFALSLAHRLHQSDDGGRVAVACIKLGVVKTNIRREFPRWMKVIVPLIIDPLLAQSPDAAASSALHVLAEASPNDPTNVLFTKIRRLKRLWPSDQLLDRQEWERLWSSADRLSETARAEDHISERATERSLSGFATT
jgi:NAD(P)-dependent dehydrogenase (short-subunit alcohol dehydrogenase family)